MLSTTSTSCWKYVFQAIWELSSCISRSIPAFAWYTKPGNDSPRLSKMTLDSGLSDAVMFTPGSFSRDDWTRCVALNWLLTESRTFCQKQMFNEFSTDSEIEIGNDHVSEFATATVRISVTIWDLMDVPCWPCKVTIRAAKKKKCDKNHAYEYWIIIHIRNRRASVLFFPRFLVFPGHPKYNKNSQMTMTAALI